MRALRPGPAGSEAAADEIRQPPEAFVIAVPVFQVTLAVIVALFVIQVVRRVAASSASPAAQAVNDGLSFLTAP